MFRSKAVYRYRTKDKDAALLPNLVEAADGGDAEPAQMQAGVED